MNVLASTESTASMMNVSSSNHSTCASIEQCENITQECLVDNRGIDEGRDLTTAQPYSLRSTHLQLGVSGLADSPLQFALL